MTVEIIVGIGIIAGLAAAGASALAHRWAKRRRWPYVPRYACGVAIALIAFAFPLFAAQPTNNALVLFGDLVLIFLFQGAATWLAHDADPDPPGSLTPEADELIRRLDEEIGR